MSGMMSAIAWMPWWAQLLAGLVLLVLGVAFLLMPFAVFGLKPRLEEVELQLGEIRAKLRVIAMRLSGTDEPQPARPVDYAPIRQPMPAAPDAAYYPDPRPAEPMRAQPAQSDPSWTRARDHARDERPRQDPGRLDGAFGTRAASFPPDPRDARPQAEPRVGRASDDWTAAQPPTERAPPAPRAAASWSEKAPPERSGDHAAFQGEPRSAYAGFGRRDAERMEPMRPDSGRGDSDGRVGSFLAGESEAGPRTPPTVNADRPYDDMPVEGLSQTLRPTHFEPPGHDARPTHSASPQPGPQATPGSWAAPRPADHAQAPSGPEFGPRADRHAADGPPWMRADERTAPAADPRHDRDDDETWRRPRAEPTLRWPPRT